MAKWEYKWYRFLTTLVTPEVSSRQLTALGQEGWEAVSTYIEPSTSPGAPIVVVVLLRRLSDERS